MSPSFERAAGQWLRATQGLSERELADAAVYESKVESFVGALQSVPRTAQPIIGALAHR